MLNDRKMLNTGFIRLGLVAGVLVLGCVSQQANAASSIANLLKCAEESDSLKRLTCYDEAVKKLQSGDPRDDTPLVTTAGATVELPDPAPDIQAVSERVPEAISQPPAADALPKPAVPAPLANASASDSASTDGLSAAPRPATPGDASGRIPTSDASDIDNFGLRPVADLSNGAAGENAVLIDGELISTVREVVNLRARRLRFVLENGQVWEKTGGPDVGLPRTGDEVAIRSQAMGAFFLRKTNANRSFRVRRIK